MDFFWHYVSKDTIDPAGKESFLRAISVASQVFNSISEYIQVFFVDICTQIGSGVLVGAYVLS